MKRLVALVLTGVFLAAGAGSSCIIVRGDKVHVPKPPKPPLP